MSVRFWLNKLVNDFGKSWIAQNGILPESQLYKLLEWRRLHEMLVQLRINCVLDVGAARGQFAINLRKIGYEGKIVSFEPVPEAFAEMSAVFAGDRKWQGHNVALGRQNGETTFNVAVESTEMSSILLPRHGSWHLRQITVPLATLDAFFDSAITDISDPSVFLKMDTQGYDVEVIHGALRSLPQVVALQSELAIRPDYVGAPLYLEALGIYRDLGFEPISLIEAARDSQSGIITEFNCVLIRDGIA